MLFALLELCCFRWFNWCNMLPALFRGCLLLSFLPIHPSDCALSEDGSNDGHRARFRPWVDLFLRAGLHAAGSFGLMKPHVCFHSQNLSSYFLKISSQVVELSTWIGFASLPVFPQKTQPCVKGHGARSRPAALQSCAMAFTCCLIKGVISLYSTP